MKMSRLFRKALIAIIVIFGLMANGTALLSAWLIYQNLTEEYISKGRAIAVSIAGASVEVLLNRDASTVQSMIDEFLNIEGVAYVYVVDSENQIISHTFIPAVPEEIRGLSESFGAVTVRDITRQGVGDFIQISAPILAGMAGVVNVGMDREIIWRKMRAAVVRQELLMLVMLCMSVVTFYVIMRGVSRPLVELSEYARRLKAHDFTAEIDIRSDDEVGELAGTMRSMAGELADLITGLERAVLSATTELQATLAHLKAIIDNLADGLLVVDTTGRVTSHNPALCAMFGLQGADLTGREARQVFAGAMASLVDEAARVTGEILTAEVRLAGGRIGKALATPIHLAPADADHEPVLSGAVILIRDITSEKEVDRMKTEFISTVSHELRTPLTSILGFAKIIRKKFLDEVGPKLPAADRKATRAAGQIGDNLGIIVSEGERLTELVNDVLDIAKMESGRIEWDMKPVSISEVIDRSVQAASAMAENAGLTLEVKADPDLPMVMGDRDRLIQVLLNLLSNAVKFTPSGSVTVRAMAKDGGARIGVLDTGLGIAPADQGIIFEKFKQAGDTLTEKPKGTGLGLPICRQIVEHHGGTIWVESEPGRGSAFWFILPLGATAGREAATDPGVARRTAEISPAHAAGERPDASCPVVLVVDDEPAVRLYLAQLFREEGFAVLCAADGLEALRLARENRPDIITMDLMMPGLDGAAAIRLLRGDPATRDIPVVAVTALPERDRMRAGADATLVKPVDEKALIEVVTSLIRGQGEASRPCVVLTMDGEEKKSPLLMYCPGRVSYASQELLWEKLGQGFSGTVFVPASISHQMDLARLAGHPDIHVVILPD